MLFAGSSIEEQSYEEAEPEDVLGLGEDGNAVRPWAQLSASLADKVNFLPCNVELLMFVSSRCDKWTPPCSW